MFSFWTSKPNAHLLNLLKLTLIQDFTKGEEGLYIFGKN
jgi:hypothetical protein